MLFESLCVRDLRVYAQANKSEVFHYHDESGLEAGAVVQTFLQVDHRDALPQLCRAVHAVEVAWGAVWYNVQKNCSPKGGSTMAVQYSEIRELLRSRADLNARLNLMPYDGTPEIKERGDGEYLYVRNV